MSSALLDRLRNTFNTLVSAYEDLKEDSEESHDLLASLGVPSEFQDGPMGRPLLLSERIRFWARKRRHQQVFLAAQRYLQGGCDSFRTIGAVERVGAWLYPFGVEMPEDVWDVEDPTVELLALLHGIMDDMRVPREARDAILSNPNCQ